MCIARYGCMLQSNSGNWDIKKEGDGGMDDG